eukprot:1588608-Prymnesium_polylepis.1
MARRASCTSGHSSSPRATRASSPSTAQGRPILFITDTSVVAFGCTPATVPRAPLPTLCIVAALTP